MTEEDSRKLFHNLKNDLASMTALLNLHKLYKDSIGTEEMLNRLFERQTVIATAYEKLYQEGDYPNVGLVLFINELLSRESSRLQIYSSNVQIKKEIANLRLPVKKIIPLGQVLVELLSNSYRHAFKAASNDRIIEFHITENNEKLKFDYMDNGSGFTEGFIPLKSRTLGMQFITALSKQLGGVPEFDISNKDCGVRFSLEITIKKD